MGCPSARTSQSRSSARGTSTGRATPLSVTKYPCRSNPARLWASKSSLVSSSGTLSESVSVSVTDPAESVSCPETELSQTLAPSRAERLSLPTPTRAGGGRGKSGPRRNDNVDPSLTKKYAFSEGEQTTLHSRLMSNVELPCNSSGTSHSCALLKNCRASSQISGPVSLRLAILIWSSKRSTHHVNKLCGSSFCP